LAYFEHSVGHLHLVSTRGNKSCQIWYLWQFLDNSSAVALQ